MELGQNLQKFKYSSRVKEVVNEDELVNRLLDQPVTLRLGEILASSTGLAMGISNAVRRKKTPAVQSLNMEGQVESNGVDAAYLAR